MIALVRVIGIVSVIIAEAQFVQPSRAGSPDPYCTAHVGPSVKIGSPILLREGSGGGVAAAGIPLPVEGVLVVGMVINLDDPVVGTAVREEIGNDLTGRESAGR